MKNKTLAWLLAIFLWWLGIHKFYLWNVLWWFIYILFCWTWVPSILWIIEWIIYFTKSDEDWDKEYNPEKKAEKKDQLYDKLLKLDSLEEKGYITEEEYKEQVKEIKKQIKDIKEEDKPKGKTKAEIEKEQKEDDDFHKKALIVMWIVFLLVVILIVVQILN